VPDLALLSSGYPLTLALPQDVKNLLKVPVQIEAGCYSVVATTNPIPGNGTHANDAMLDFVVLPHRARRCTDNVAAIGRSNSGRREN
jgi:hypothetical protein